MLDLMREMARRFEVDVRAYVPTLPNHLHPAADAQDASRVYRSCRPWAQLCAHFNNRHGRTGTLWEDAIAAVLQAEQWLMATMVSHGSQPRRAWLVACGGLARSSYAHNAGLRSDALISPCVLFLGSGSTPFAMRCRFTSGAVEAGLDADTQAQISHAELRGWALGEPDFTGKFADRKPSDA